MANSAAAAKAAKAEANQTDSHVYLFKGKKFTFPANYKKVSPRVFEAGEEGKNIGFVRGLMGQEQWDRFNDELGATMEDLEALSEWLGSSYGGFKNVGESSASDAS